ncbi:MAG: hypothetical protein QMD88_06795 [Coprothermobacterota bacterium]|nr:hypothetical protein [Coprothermobacterota bacterium]
MCPDCGKDVSSSAPNCPHCGRPMAAFSGKAVQTRCKGGTYEAIGFLLIVAGIIAYFFLGYLSWILMGVGFILFLVGRFMKRFKALLYAMCFHPFNISRY